MKDKLEERAQCSVGGNSHAVNWVPVTG